MEKQVSLGEKFKMFTEGKGEAPVLHSRVGVKFSVNDTKMNVILSVEEIDADGEIVEIKGGRIRNPENGIPMIDSHNSWSSVVNNGLGAVRNPVFGIKDGKPMLVGEPDFAPTPAGEIAKILYMGVNGGKPYFTDVSMGFMVYDYDNATRTIKEWEVFELSLVTAGSNRGARFEQKKAIPEEPTELDVNIAKDLARFKQIAEPFKEFTKLFLSDSFCEKLSYEKDGDLLLDINNIYDIIVKRFDADIKVAPKPAQVAPEISVKQNMANPKLVEKLVLQEMQKLLDKKG